jgi:hypothetical protein
LVGFRPITPRFTSGEFFIMATSEQVEVAGNAYWNYLQSLQGKPQGKRFKLDKDFAGAMNAALDAAAKIESKNNGGEDTTR